ncbi:MAG: glycosyltransferase family A protein [Nitrospiraceae bacterium]
MSERVTVCIPVYKRLNFLPEALRSVAGQDYPHIDLLVSDNGQNGDKIPALVKQWYGKPYRFRQNSVTVDCSSHYNQLIQDAGGEYVLIFGDDDELSPTLVSDLVEVLRRYPQAPVALPRQEKMDEQGRALRSSSDRVPELLSGEDFIRAWCRYTYEFQTLSTVLFRTPEVRKAGGFPIMPNANGDEDILMIRMTVGRSIAFVNRSCVRKREHEKSLGLACDYQELVDASVLFTRILDTDPQIQAYAQRDPKTWSELRGLLGKMSWETCYSRWSTMYRARMPFLGWARAAFAMPWLPEYYRAVLQTLWEEARYRFFTGLKRALPFLGSTDRALHK